MAASITEELVRDHLRKVNYPGFSRNIVSFGLVRDVKINGANVAIRLSLATRDPQIPELLKKEIEGELRQIKELGEVTLHVDLQNPPEQPDSPAMQATAIDGVRHVVAVASGKGGVGKSTVAANLATALSLQGHRTGICDCDIYGPSIGLMFNCSDRPYATSENRILPQERLGLKLMSMGFFLEGDAPAVLRGPMVTRYTQQFLRNVDWGKLDFLILDLPPGTGDIQLTIVQTLALSGAVIVTTPQEVALIDARKAVGMFEKVHVNVLGIIENMSYFLCPSDGISYDIFGSGGGQREAERLNVPLLGQIPIDMETRKASDIGQPIACQMDSNPAGNAFHNIAKKIAQVLQSTT